MAKPVGVATKIFSILFLASLKSFAAYSFLFVVGDRLKNEFESIILVTTGKIIEDKPF